MKIFGWLADHGGCGWYRIMLPLGALQQSGRAQVRFAGRTTESDFDVDVFIAQRTFNVGPSSRWQAYARRPNRPLLVYELDDDLMHITSDNPAAAVFNDPGTQRRLRENIEVADLVTVSTEPLAEQVSQFNPRVAVLPNCVPSDMLQWRHGGYADRLTIGWQGSPTHDRDWARAAPHIAKWMRTNPHAEMHTFGAIPKSFPQLVRHRHSDWTSDIPSYYTSIDWDVALAPLRNTLFNRSKSDIRMLEAAMLGIPTIASAVPAYRTIQDGVTGYLVSRDTTWGDALNLLADSQRRSEMSSAALAYAHTRTIEANAHLWFEAYEKAKNGDLT